MIIVLKSKQITGTDSLHGNVAQLVEQGPFKAKVPGSSPGIPTRKN